MHPLSFSEYRRLRQAGDMLVSADKTVALQLVPCMPANYQAAHNFWAWVWMLSIPFFVVCAFFTYGFSLLGLITITPMLRGGVRDSAAQFVVEISDANPEFYELAIQSGGLVVKPKPGALPGNAQPLSAPPIKSARSIPPRKVCYDVARFLAESGDIPVLDQSVLPFPKEEIITALQIYASLLKKTGQQEEYREVVGVLLHVNKFKPIESKDRALVDAINRGEGLFGKWRGNPAEWPEPQNHNERESLRIFTEMISKYSV